MEESNEGGEGGIKRGQGREYGGTDKIRVFMRGNLI